MSGGRSLLLLLLSALAWTAGGCRRSPSVVYDDLAQTVRHGDVKTALAGVDTALKENADSPEWSWRFRVLKAQILVSQSSVDQTLSVLQGELPASLVNSDVAVRKLLMEAVAYRYAQQFDNAKNRIDQANQLAAAAAPQILCEIARVQGELDVDLKKYSDADASFQQSLKLAEAHHRPDQKAAALVDLARLATSEDRFDEAIDLSKPALQLSRELDMQGLVATALGNMAWNYFQLGDFENALTYFQQAADASEKIGLTGYTFYWRTGVANSHLALHSPASAEALLKDTLQRARALNDPATITECLNALSEIALKAGRVEEAEKYNAEALQIENNGQDHFGTIQSLLLHARIQSASSDFRSAEHTLDRVIHDSSADLQSLWQARAQMAEVRDAAGQPLQASAEYRASIGAIDRVYSSIKADELRLGFLSGTIEFYESYIDFLVRQHREAEALQIAETSRARTLQRGLASQSVKTQSVSNNPQQLARTLNATLLFYWLGEKHSFLWAISGSQTRLCALPSASELDPLIRGYAKQQAQGSDVRHSSESDGEKLYALLVAPAEKMIPRGSRVVILPDQSLYSLNFETLIAPGTQPHFWIEDATISVANSLTLLAAGAAHHASQRRSLLLVGNTVQASTDFPALRQAPQEMTLVQNHFTQVPHVILGKQQATPSAYLASRPGQYSYLHFVTHGTASRARPLESALILSPDGGSYKLYARDIVAKHLNADLVTISACNGSGTRTYSGEGLVGLSWAFLRAGAHNVIGALWEVSDTATPQLMDKLYSGLAAGEDPATALRNAKLAFLHSGNVYAKPFYWAPFQIYSGS